MTSILLKDIVDEFESQIDDPEEKFITTGVSWEQYEKLLDRLGDSLRYRVTYLDGILEIMSPSRRHERSKSVIASLLEAYFQERRIQYFPLGSTTLCKEEKKGGTEPDESYCIGMDKEIPDLAIEVVVTSGGVDKLAVYKKLGVREVWFWQNDRFSVYCLRGDEYEKIPASELLPNLDLELLSQYVTHTDILESILEFRAQIRQNK
ncbi:hypothetical protein Ple7327_4351 [Pleurocapsa sp. PCC 7327]|uniref:Uma2 family endonuclease n=1 Tax=Pleurocapsa sp. PCC 7327 TaxID=118163 RepID=UPI00029FB2DE|nr:Uma2 family endonuclease [Pleurocapsa sp. PCC 7327]AFY79462.1 hypothetical protein Ple7327_4351 [Pleurocapsa sp. PCC 7327]